MVDDSPSRTLEKICSVVGAPKVGGAVAISDDLEEEEDGRGEGR